MNRRNGRYTAAIQGGGGTGFRPGHWRADRPTGTPVPEPTCNHEPAGLEREKNGAFRDPRTAANLAEHAAIIAPRRYRP